MSNLKEKGDSVKYPRIVGEKGPKPDMHELLHFFVPNHGRLWKSLMRAHLGDYEKLESKLKNQG